MWQARSQKLMLGGSFGQNVDLFEKIVDLFTKLIVDLFTKVWTFFTIFLNKIVDLFNKIVLERGVLQHLEKPPGYTGLCSLAL